jgi:hypothetical protein
MADLSSIFDQTGTVRRPAYGQLLQEFGALRLRILAAMG